MSGYVNVHVLNALSEHANVLASSAVAAFQDGADQLPPFLFLPVPTCQSERAPKRDGQQPNLLCDRCRSSSKMCFENSFFLHHVVVLGVEAEGCAHGRMMLCLNLGLFQRQLQRQSGDSSVLGVTDFCVSLHLFPEFPAPLIFSVFCIEFCDSGMRDAYGNTGSYRGNILFLFTHLPFLPLTVLFLTSICVLFYLTQKKKFMLVNNCTRASL